MCYKYRKVKNPRYYTLSVKKYFYLLLAIHVILMVKKDLKKKCQLRKIVSLIM